MTTITERMTTVFQRAIEACWDKIQRHKARVIHEEDEEDIHQDSYHIIKFDGLIFEYDFRHSGEDEIDFESVSVRFILYQSNKSRWMSCLTFNDKHGKEHAKEKIKSLEGKNIYSL